MLKPLKCDVCGRFVAIQDIADKKATRRIVTPDSDYSHEAYETLCPTHAMEAYEEATK